MRPRTVNHRLNALNARFDALDSWIRDILIVKEPGTVVAADALEGLRRSIISLPPLRRQHLAHLARIDSAVEAGEDQAALRLLLRELRAEARLERIDDATGPLRPFFDIVGDGDGPLEVVRSAYVDIDPSGLVQPVMPGLARCSLDVQPDEETNDAPESAELLGEGDR